MKEIKKNNIKVVLNGQGSDESWCGYDTNIIGYFLLDKLFSKPGTLLSQLKSISQKMKVSSDFILLQIFKAIVSRKFGSTLRSKYDEKIFPCLSDKFITENSNYFTNPRYDKFSSENLESYMKYNIQYQGFNQILHYEDHSSMQSSIEMRSPFIDYRLIEFAFSLPVEKKLDDGITKKILRELFNTKIPNSIVKNYRKVGFITPFDDWMNDNKTKDYIYQLITSDSFQSKSVFNAQKIKSIFDSKENYKKFPYWRILNLELWSRVYNISNL